MCVFVCVTERAGRAVCERDRMRERGGERECVCVREREQDVQNERDRMRVRGRERVCV